MGTWDIGAFDNDTALDWVGDLESAADHAPFQAAFAAVQRGSADYLEAQECEEAIAAAEVLAYQAGHPSAPLPEEVERWLSGKPAPTRDLLRDAQRALDAILAESELKELWEDNRELYPTWVAAVEHLRTRLQSAEQGA